MQEIEEASAAPLLNAGAFTVPYCHPRSLSFAVAHGGRRAMTAPQERQNNSAKLSDGPERLYEEESDRGNLQLASN